MDKIDLMKLTIFRKLSEDPILKKAVELITKVTNGNFKDEDQINLYYEVTSELVDRVEQNDLEGNLWKSYLLDLIVKDENLFSLFSERIGQRLEGQLLMLAALDMKILLQLYHLDWQELRVNLGISEDLNIEEFPNYLVSGDANVFYLDHLRGLKEKYNSTNDPKELTGILKGYYAQNGCGYFSEFVAFRWEKERGLVGVKNADPIRLEDLVGYEYQKEVLLKNTEAFIKGNDANNVLLFGDKGTGKSSSVKALANRYAAQGLRLVELSKANIMDFPKLLERIKDRGLKFIVFLDDLSFEEFEVEYKHIKAMIEGGIEKRPKNVLIYATSNRRHLIKENWKDQENSGEIRISDSVQEKLSLADRFGITITFGTPDQEEYLTIVKELARKTGLHLSQEELQRRALQWELWYHGRSGRTAQQFINYLLGEAEE